MHPPEGGVSAILPLLSDMGKFWLPSSHCWRYFSTNSCHHSTRVVREGGSDERRKPSCLPVEHLFPGATTLDGLCSSPLGAAVDGASLADNQIFLPLALAKNRREKLDHGRAKGPCFSLLASCPDFLPHLEALTQDMSRQIGQGASPVWRH